MGHLPNLNTCQPREFVSIDIVGPLPVSRGNRYIITMIDHATKYMIGIPVGNVNAKTVADVFKTHWMLLFGPPRILHSDNGPQFISAVFEELLAGNKIAHSRTTVYHPQGNGLLERFHGTLKDRLRAALLNKPYWSESLTEAVHNINRHVNSSGFSAYLCMLGFQPKAPGDWSDSEPRQPCKLPCPKIVYPRIFHPKSCFSPKFGPPLQVSARISEQLVRTVDGQILNLNNCKPVF